MQVSIDDREALLAVPPAALTAYARAVGWRRHEPYRGVADIYVGRDLPEVVLPRSQHLDDYASTVSELIKLFSRLSGENQLSIYRSLVTADRDLVRVWTNGSADGTVNLDDGLELMGAARDLLVAAACSLDEPRPAYRVEEGGQAVRLVGGMRIGHADQGDFTAYLMTPALPPPVVTPFPGEHGEDPPVERRLTVRMLEATTAVRRLTRLAEAERENALDASVQKGLSANFCEALLRAMKPFSVLYVSVSWARTHPAPEVPPTLRFRERHTDFISNLAQSLRKRSPQPAVRRPAAHSGTTSAPRTSTLEQLA